MPLTEQPNARLISAALEQLTAISPNTRQVKVNFPDGSTYQFNGTTEPIRGRRIVIPENGHGARNLTTEVPEIIENPREILLPAEIGVRFVAGALAFEALDEIILDIAAQTPNDQLTQLTLDRQLIMVNQDEDTIRMVDTETQAQMQAIGTRVATATKTKKKHDGEGRVRIHGYSRVTKKGESQ